MRQQISFDKLTLWDLGRERSSHSVEWQARAIDQYCGRKSDQTMVIVNRKHFWLRSWYLYRVK